MMLLYVSPQRSDLPAIFESLNDDTLGLILQFVGNKSYRSFGGINKRCKEVYITSGMTKETFLFGYAPLSIIQDNYVNVPSYVYVSANFTYFTSLQEKKKKLLIGICKIAAKEEKYDLLNEVLSNIEVKNDKRDIFDYVDIYAAQNGKLNVLKWTRDMGVPFNKKYGCAWTAARNGQLHILKWLREERGLELDWKLYNEAANRGQLHVMKWLREQACPWGDYTLKDAAYKGNLEVLQWLHDEGCPWPEDHRVYECILKPETLEWCRANAYGGRIILD